MAEDMHRSEEQKLEEMLFSGVRSERGMEMGSKEWNDFRERLRFQGREERNNRKA